MAQLGRDVQKDPVDTAVWWTEYVLRHTKEELDLKKPMGRHLYWWQKRGLDVWMFVGITFLAGCYVAYILGIKLLRKIFGAKDKLASKNGPTKKNN